MSGLIGKQVRAFYVNKGELIYYDGTITGEKDNLVVLSNIETTLSNKMELGGSRTQIINTLSSSFVRFDLKQ